MAEYLQKRRTDLFAAGRDGHSYAFTEWRAWTGHERERLVARNPGYTGFDALARDLVAVRDDRMKLVRASDGSAALFDSTRIRPKSTTSSHRSRWTRPVSDPSSTRDSRNGLHGRAPRST